MTRSQTTSNRPTPLTPFAVQGKYPNILQTKMHKRPEEQSTMQSLSRAMQRLPLKFYKSQTLYPQDQPAVKLILPSVTSFLTIGRLQQIIAGNKFFRNLFCVLKHTLIFFFCNLIYSLGYIEKRCNRYTATVFDNKI